MGSVGLKLVGMRRDDYVLMQFAIIPIVFQPDYSGNQPK